MAGDRRFMFKTWEQRMYSGSNDSQLVQCMCLTKLVRLKRLSVLNSSPLPESILLSIFWQTTNEQELFRTLKR